MGKRGPKPLPSNVHVLRGNPSKLPRAQLRDAAGPINEIPPPPRHLKGEALKEWKRITPELLRLGLISKLDTAALAMYCTSWGRHIEAEHKIRELGEAGLIRESQNGFESPTVWVNISTRSMEQCRKFLAEFGLSPSARSNVTPGQDTGDLFKGTEHEKPGLGDLIK